MPHLDYPTPWFFARRLLNSTLCANEYVTCSRILFQQAHVPPLNRNLGPPDSDIAGRRRMLEPAKLSDFGSHDFADHFADIPRTGSHEKSPPSKMRKLARAIAKD